MNLTSTNALPAAPGKGFVIAVWTLSGVAALAFLAAGLAKLAGAAPMVAVFAAIGVGQWFRFATGLLEVAGAIGLVIPRYSFYAASLLATVMVGAVAAHLTVLGGSPAAPLFLLALTGTIAYLRSRQVL